MPDWAAVLADIRSRTDRDVSIDRAVPVGGGSINEAWKLECADQYYFVKLNRPDRLSMFEAEFEGLCALRDARALRVPEPLVCGSDENGSWLVCEFIDMGSRSRASESMLGERLALQHRICAERFGWHRDNTIGSTPQINGWMDDWPAFWRDRRLGFQLQLLIRRGMGGGVAASLERLMDGLPQFFSSYTPAASLLHGDLWGGNRGFDMQGRPVIFDPAVYYGDREADIAMTELFGGFGADFYAAYRAAWPLDAGYVVRRELYNLYHILNHANLFGGGYLTQAEGMIARLLAELR